MGTFSLPSPGRRSLSYGLPVTLSMMSLQLAPSKQPMISGRHLDPTSTLRCSSLSGQMFG